MRESFLSLLSETEKYNTHKIPVLDWAESPKAQLPSQQLEQEWSFQHWLNFFAPSLAPVSSGAVAAGAGSLSGA